jgi:hypothetical protein
MNRSSSNSLQILFQILAHDALPKNICRDCRFQLEKTAYFRQVAKSCDSRLKKHFRLISHNKPSNLLSKDYRDDDIEELEETYLASYVSLALAGSGKFGFHC